MREKHIHIQYYAVLRETAGVSSEVLVTGADTPRAVYGELQERYGFSLTPDLLRVAVNERFSDWDTPLSTGDHLVFIPPVAGG